MKKKNVSGRVKRTLLILLSVVLTVVLVSLIMGVAYMERMLNLINKNPDDSTMSSSEYEEFLKDQAGSLDSNYTGEVDDPNDVQWGENKEPVKDEAHIINIMLIGQDRRPGEGRQRSDVMILCSVNTATKELTMTSFMRDMYVQIPGYSPNKMNATYQLGGMKLLDKCMEVNFGVHIDGNLEVDFDGFEKLIDLVGGVDVELSNSEANHLIKLGHSAKAGMNHLNGSAALDYARNRSIGNADFTRTERQRKIVTALIEKSRGMNLNQMKKLMENALPMLTTDLTNRQILDYIMELLPIMGELKVVNQRIPADGTFKYAYYNYIGSVLVPDLEANRELLKGSMTKDSQ